MIFVAPEDWISGDNLWRVGFHLDALPLIGIMSGLVEILMTVYDPQEKVVVFIVRSLDKTGALFHGGFLKGNQIQRYRLVDQGLLVQSDVTNVSSSCIS
jgi:hypothetical protein